MNKPKGISSYDVIREIKRQIGKGIKIGHAGTLDPFATGLLIILFNEATRIFPIINSYPKVYKAKIRLGITTDTDDITGKILKRKEKLPEYKREEIELLLKRYEGEIEQIPPRFSALKDKGIPLYKKARRGEEFSPRKRRVLVYKIDLLSLNKDSIEIRTCVSGGTYIRSLSRDIGKELGCGGTLEELVREKIGRFSIEDSITNLTEEEIKKNIIPIASALYPFPEVVLKPGREKKALNGQKILPEDLVGPFPEETLNLKIFSSQRDILFWGKVIRGEYIAPERLLSKD